MKKLVWTLALALLCLSSCRDYRYRVEDSIYVPVVTDISILDIQENCATLSFEVRETSELGVGQCGILFSLSYFDNPKEKLLFLYERFCIFEVQKHCCPVKVPDDYYKV